MRVLACKALVCTLALLTHTWAELDSHAMPYLVSTASVCVADALDVGSPQRVFVVATGSQWPYRAINVLPDASFTLTGSCWAHASQVQVGWQRAELSDRPLEQGSQGCTYIKHVYSMALWLQYAMSAT